VVDLLKGRQRPGVRYQSLALDPRNGPVRDGRLLHPWWYWGGEASLRVDGTKMQLTSIPDSEWATVEAAARVFWEEIASESETKAKVVDIIKKYNADMDKAGRPYRYS